MEEKKELLKTYILANVAPILEDFIFGNDIPDSVVINANIDINDLYNENESTWYNKLTKENKKVLVIEKLDSIKKEEQVKFLELLKYSKIGSLVLPEDVVIIITANQVNDNTINEEVYSLVAHIRG